MVDPKEAAYQREYYLRNRKLKGRQKRNEPLPSPKSNGQIKNVRTPQNRSQSESAKARVGRLTAKVASLEKSLTEAMQELTKLRASKRKSDREDSDGKTTAKERQSSKEYREKNKSKIAKKAAEETKETSGSKAKSSSSSKSSGGSTSSSSSSKSTGGSGEAALVARIKGIRSALTNARQQLSAAKKAA